MDVDEKKAYVIAIFIQVIYTGLYVISKAAFNQGMNTYVFVFYRQATATLLLLPLAIFLQRRNKAPPMSLRLFIKFFLCALLGNTISMNLDNISVKYTSATVASAASNSVPVITFFLAVLLRLEVIRLRSLSGVAKMAGVGLCLGGVLVIALYSGPAISPLNRHRAFDSQAAESGGGGGGGGGVGTRARWMKGTFLKLLSDVTWAMWIVLQASALMEYPNKLLATVLQCLLSTLQSLLLAAAVVRRPAAWRLRLDAGLLAVAYSGFVVTGVSFYLQAWCIEKKGPVFLAMSNPLCFVFTIFCSSFFLGEIVHLGSIVGGILLVAGLYSVLWAKSKEQTTLAAAAAVNQQQELSQAPADNSRQTPEQQA